MIRKIMLAIFALAPAAVLAGPISKFESNTPSIDTVSQVPLHDLERCLIDLDGHPAPQVYAQSDRPGLVRMLWMTRDKAVDRADLEATTQGTRVRIWKGSNQMRACVETGRSDGAVHR